MKRFASWLVLLAVAVLLGNCALPFYSSYQLSEDNRWLAHTREVQTAVTALLSTIQDAETGQRGYLITGEDRYLKPYQAAVAQIQDRFERLHELTADNPRQQEPLVQLETSVTEKLEELAMTIRMRQHEGFIAAQEMVQSDRGYREMEAIRRQVERMQAEEEKLLQKRSAAAQAGRRRTALALSFSVVLAAMLLGLTAYSAHRRATERELSEAAVRRERELLQQILTSIGDGVVTTDCGLHVAFMNEVAQTLTGRSWEQARGQPLDDVLAIATEAGGEPAENPAARALREDRVIKLTSNTALLTRNTALLAVDCTAAPIRDAAGIAAGTVVVFRDITAQRRAEEDRARLAAVVDCSEDAIVTEGPTGLIQSWNAGAERLYGYRAEEVVGGPISLILPPGEDALAERKKQVWQGDRVEPGEVVRRRRDGALIPVSVSVSPVRGTQGTVVAAAVIARDISERKRAEAELRRSADEIYDLYNNAPCGYHSLDPTGLFVRVNETELKWLGRSREEVVGKLRFPDCLTPAGQKVYADKFPLFLERGWAKDVEVEVLRKDGSVLVLLLSATAVRNSAGRVVHSRVALIDITERRELEERLRLAQKAEAVAQLASGVAHEFNNALTGINVSAELLLARLQPDDMSRSLVGALQKSATRAGWVNRQLALFSGRQGRGQGTVDLNRVARTVGEQAAGKVANAVEVVFELAAKPVACCGDWPALEQAVHNLVDNAREAMPAGGRLTLRTEVAEADGDGPDLPAGHYAVLAVRDTGRGMSDAVRARLFEPFFTTKEVGKGPGLGLAVVHGVVQHNGGRIRVESVPGSGTTVTLFMPAAGAAKGQD